jgi:hypothetical protein
MTHASQTDWTVFARQSCITRELPTGPRLLLEGDWPAPVCASDWSLDSIFDARWPSIDDEALRLADLAAEGDSVCPANAGQPSPAWLEGLALRYYLVKLLRPLAFLFQHEQGRTISAARLVLEAGRDEDYTGLFEEAARADRRCFKIDWRTAHGRAPVAAEPAWWRRWAGRFATRSPRRPSRQGSLTVFFRGNPLLLNPICGRVLDEGGSAVWIWDQWCFRSWRDWLGRPVGQCLAANVEGRPPAGPPIDIPPLEFLGCRLDPLVKRFVERRRAVEGPRLARLDAAVRRALDRGPPDVVVLDEDATAPARVVIAAAREAGLPTVVIQHGAPFIRFGFSGPAADWHLVWGPTTTRQLAGWGWPADRIVHVGSPRLGGVRPHAPIGRPTALLLTTVPARDDRPDSTAFHLTRRTHADMLRCAFEAVRLLGGHDVLVRLHPRSADSSDLRRMTAEYAGYDVRFSRDEPLEACVRRASWGLSCASSAGIEAAAMGLPVIQLMPAGSSNLIRAEEWGLLGTARTAEEVLRLRADRLPLRSGRKILQDPVFSLRGDEAVEAIMEHVHRIAARDPASAGCTAPLTPA